MLFLFVVYGLKLVIVESFIKEIALAFLFFMLSFFVLLLVGMEVM